MKLNSNIDLQQLQYFVAVVDAGSISRAARLCNIAQPALSKRIANLEYTMRVPLLQRGHMGIFATEQGLLLYQAAQRVLKDMEKVIDQVHSAENNPQGEVRVGCVNSVAKLLGAPLAVAIREKFSAIRLSFVVGQTGDIHRSLCDGLLDIALIVHDHEMDNLSIDLMLTEDLFIVASPRLEGLPSEDVIDPESLGDLPFVFPTARTFASGRYTVEFFRRKGITLNVVSEIDGDAIRTLIASGYGACVLPASFVADDVQSGDVCLKRLRDMPLQRTLALCSPRDRLRTLAARAVAAELQQSIRQQVAAGAWNFVKIH